VPVVQGIESTSRIGRLLPRPKKLGLPRNHVAAVCYRLQDNQVHFLLVRTHAGRWTFPKGRVDDDPNRAAAAAREAYEEAGVFGRVEAQPICNYLHSKQATLHDDEHLVDAHLCEVVSTVPPEELHRDPTWFDPEKAKRRLCENRKRKYGAELSRVVDSALEHIARRHPHTTNPLV